MSIYSTGINPYQLNITNTSNSLVQNINQTSNYVLNTSNSILNNLLGTQRLFFKDTSNNTNVVTLNSSNSILLNNRTKIDSNGLSVYHNDVIIPLNNGWVNVDGRLNQNTNDITTINTEITSIDTSITTINGTLTTIGGDITTLQASVTANTTDIATLNTGLAANVAATGVNSAAITANGLVTAGNTTAIGTLQTNSLNFGMIGSGDIGSYNGGLGNYLNLVFNTDHFVDVAVVGTNRQFNLSSSYANLPTTKNNKITWNSPRSSLW